MKIDDLVPAPYNPRTITPEALKGLQVSVRELGDISGICFNRTTKQMFAGHQRVRALKEEFGDALKVVGDDASGYSIETPKGDRFSIRMVDWPEDKERLANLAANNHFIQGDWTETAEDVLGQAAIDFPELSEQLRLNDLDLDLVVQRGGKKNIEEGKDAEPDVDHAEELRKKWGVEPGQIWELGAHRLMCGDSTKSADVSKLLAGDAPPLMVTDPPYGVNYDPSWRERAGVNLNPDKLGKVENDDRADWSEAWRLFPGDIAYVYHAGMWASTVQASLEICGFQVRAQIIWAKDRMALSRGDYHWQHEPVWYAVREGKQGHRTDDRSQTTLWTIPSREDSGHGHGTQKPLECMARPIRNHDCEMVYDPFVGSGTTLIACENLGRKCRAMEIAPQYVAVCLQRWADAFQKTPKKL